MTNFGALSQLAIRLIPLQINRLLMTHLLKTSDMRHQPPISTRTLEELENLQYQKIRWHLEVTQPV